MVSDRCAWADGLARLIGVSSNARGARGRDLKVPASGYLACLCVEGRTERRDGWTSAPARGAS